MGQRAAMLAAAGGGGGGGPTTAEEGEEERARAVTPDGTGFGGREGSKRMRVA